MTNDVVIIIPARFDSKRMPGKPLFPINGKEMILYACESAALTGFPVYVATESDKIKDCVEKHGFNCIVNKRSHLNGTSRVSEALEIIESIEGREFNTVINFQCDEPFVEPRDIKRLISKHLENQGQITTLISIIPDSMLKDALENKNVVKVETDFKGRALTFSREGIPFLRNNESASEIAHRAHVGIYAFGKKTLKEIIKLPSCSLERSEDLEQLRWLYYGYEIETLEAEKYTIGINELGDLESIL